MGIINVVKSISGGLLGALSPLIIDGVYGGFWNFRNRMKDKIKVDGFWKSFYYIYLERKDSFIGAKTLFHGVPYFPHGISGVFISTNAEIGEGCTIFHQVTIGANTIAGHPKAGSPVIGNNVYIGAGAKIIGSVRIGDNCRIGANCVVVEDMPNNSTAVAAKTRIILSDEPKINAHLSPDQIKEKLIIDNNSKSNTPPRLKFETKHVYLQENCQLCKCGVLFRKAC